MPTLFLIFLVAIYLFICYQDFKSREVYLLAYIVLYGIYAGAIITSSLPVNIDFVIINSCLLIAVTSLLFMYYLVKYSSYAIIKLRASIGLGDVLLLPAFALSFSPGNLIIVFVSSLIISLGYHAFKIIRPDGIKTIPLAGIQSFLLSVILIADFFGVCKMQIDYFPLF